MKLKETTTPYTPLKHEIGLMTQKEFLDFRNPGHKFHGSYAYQETIQSLNQNYGMNWWPLVTNKGSFFVQWSESEGKGLFYNNDKSKIIASYDGDTLWRTVYFPKSLLNYQDPKNLYNRQSGNIKLQPKKVVTVKYITNEKDINGYAVRNTDEYPEILQRVKAGDKLLTLRTEKPEYKENSGKDIVVMNQDLQVVARASNEWGCTLLQVAAEYKGLRLGTLLGNIWYRLNPDFKSGGFTPAGQQNALRIWADRVREFLANGWYKELVDSGKITQGKIRQIIAGLPKREQGNAKSEDDKKDKGHLLVFTDNQSMFVLYNSNFIEERLEEHIYGFGFIRGTSNIPFIYALDYEPEHREASTYIILQIARNNQMKLDISVEASDHVELSGLQDIELNDGVVWLTKDHINLRAEMQKEIRERKPKDPYSEIEYSLQEMAEAKWK